MRRSIKVDALGQQPLQFDRADFRSVLLGLAALLRLLVAVEFAFDPVGGAVEQVNLGPQQVFEVGLQAGVGEGGDQGIEDVGDRGADSALFGQRPGVGFVLEGAVSVELEFGQDRGGRGFGMVRLAVGERAIGHRGGSPADRAHRGLRRRRRAGAARACTAGRQPERPEQSGGRCGTAILFRDAKTPEGPRALPERLGAGGK